MTPPNTIGHYRVDGLLGSGGMGEVYAATDTRTGERAAVKVLNPAALADPDHLRRFLQEAKTIGLLSHPNIVRLIDTGIADVEGVPTHYIAMEMLEGRTLDQVIPAGGLPAPQAIALALPILSALETAHAAGVAHRDLKPRNIMVTADGSPRLLDFGLAKRVGSMAADPAGVTVSMSQPLTMGATIVGTAAYMSPEQAEGKTSGARSDVFSFGSILYEMLTGRRAFEGETPMSTISAVLMREPAPLTLAEAPPEIAAVIERCLRKDPSRRYQSIGDVRVSLEDAAEAIRRPRPAQAGSTRRRWVTLAAAGVGGAAAGALLGRRLWHRPLPEPLRLTFRRGDVISARFAPGGIVYSAAWGGDPLRTFVAQPGNRESRPLDLPPAWVQSVSAKGELAMLLGREQTGTLARVPIGGGTPREILEDVSWADWAPDGESLAIVRRVAGVFRVEYPVGTVLLEAPARKPELPRVSPDGSRVAVLAYDAATGDYEVNVIGAGQRPEVIARGFRVVAGLAWASGGSDVLVAGARTGEPPGIYRVSASGGERVAYRIPGWPHLLDCAPNGDLLVAAVTSRLGIAARTPFSAGERDLAWLDGSRANDISANGETLLFTEINSGEDRNTEIYLRKTDGAPAVRIGRGNRATLSPDGRFVACLRNGAKGSQIAVLPTGTGEERILPADGLRYESVECHPDGKRLLFTAAGENGHRRSYLRQISGGAAEPVTPEGITVSRISPDGQFATSAVNGRLQVRPLGGGSAVTVTALERGEQVCRWSRDGRHLFLAAVEHGGSAVELTRAAVADGRREALRKLTPIEPGAVFWGLPALSDDGAYYAASFRQDLSELYLIKGVR